MLDELEAAAVKDTIVLLARDPAVNLMEQANSGEEVVTGLNHTI
jgi:hypothetical protein